MKKLNSKKYKDNLKKTKSKKHNYILNTIITLMYIFLVVFIGFSIYIYLTAPSFDKELLYKKESSNIYDNNLNLITTIGTEKRQVISYDDIGEVLIDAIVSAEDSRFYMHNGFDAPRFFKASVYWLRGIDNGGASTLGMQISKNTFTNTNSKGIEGIIRKFKDIYMSVFKLNKNYSKKEVLEFYVNAPYLGSGSYGVEQASLTYFNKHAKDLTLVEAATIAGLFQAPSKYDPILYPENANIRKNTIIDLMLRHGYINEKEAECAKNINVEDIVRKENLYLSPYQGFIDTVVEEIIEKENINPYETSMDIYTTMDRDSQNVINDFYKNYNFKDDKVQVGIGVINNDNGEIIAVGAGRNKTTELSLNYATGIKRHPGSTAKPLFDYGPGIEYNGWSSSTLFEDSKVKYTNGGYIKNIDGKYLGTLTLKECLVKSRNTCALKAFKRVKNSNINKFVTSLGITPEYLNKNNTYINEAHSIGAFTGVSPITLAGAYQAFGNGGIYNEPHSYRKIIYKSSIGNVEQERNYISRRAMKETTAYIISDILKNVTSRKTKIKGTDIATKTGTSSYDETALKKLHLPSSVVRDSWTVTFTKSHTISIWYGYDELYKKNYITNNASFNERVKIQSKIVKGIVNEGEKFNKPKGIITTKEVITNEDGTEKTITGLKAKN